MIYIYASFYECQGTEHKPDLEHRLGRKLLFSLVRDVYGWKMSEDQMRDKIIKGPHGKPLFNCAGPCFSTSHCPGLVLCAAADNPLGTDAEKIRPFRDSILKRTLTEAERAVFEEKRQAAGQSAADRELFFRFWTLKESGIKHSGLGLGEPLTAYEFNLGRGALYDSIFRKIDSKRPELCFYQTKLRPDYIISLCCEENPQAVCLTMKTFPE